ncbi:dTDP-glucose 4,6-dehydratase [Candidatus Pacearchaeota archaeon]|nr:dTDP-glucose 4,6-dehydratase [Candidatus Pacearchaeota archaeon]
MNLLITGCAGFIGSHVTEEFINSGYKVIGVDKLTYAGKIENLNSVINHPNFSLMQLCINTTPVLKFLIEQNKIDWVIHLAAETHVDNSIESSDVFMKTNILGTKSIIGCCYATGTKLLHFSTDEVYGPAYNKTFIERSKLNPTNPYSASKAAAEHLVTSYANTYGLGYIIVRPSNNFGPRQHDEKFLPTILRKLKLDEKIPVYGDGQQEREWMYVKETAKATRFILENSSMNETYNVSSKFHLKNIEVVERVCKLMDKNLEECIEYVEDRPGHDFNYSINPNKMNKLGYNVHNDFDGYVKELIV